MAKTTDADRLWNEALEHFAARRHSAAEACCQRVIACAPTLPLPHALLSHLFHLRGLLRPSKFHAHEACRHAVGAHWTDLLQVSATLVAIDERRLAREVLACVDPHDPANREGFADIARQFAAVGDDASSRYFQELAESAAARTRAFKVPTHS